MNDEIPRLKKRKEPATGKKNRKRFVKAVLFRPDEVWPEWFDLQVDNSRAIFSLHRAIGCDSFESYPISERLTLFFDEYCMFNDNRFKPNHCFARYTPSPEFTTFYGNVVLLAMRPFCADRIDWGFALDHPDEKPLDGERWPRDERLEVDVTILEVLELPKILFADLRDREAFNDRMRYGFWRTENFHKISFANQQIEKP